MFNNFFTNASIKLARDKFEDNMFFKPITKSSTIENILEFIIFQATYH